MASTSLLPPTPPPVDAIATATTLPVDDTPDASATRLPAIFSPKAGDATPAAVPELNAPS